MATDLDHARHGLLAHSLHQVSNGLSMTIFYLKSFTSYKGWFVAPPKPIDVKLPSVKPILSYADKVKESSNPTSLLHSISVEPEQCPYKQFMDFYDAPKEEDMLLKALRISTSFLNKAKVFASSSIDQAHAAATLLREHSDGLSASSFQDWMTDFKLLLQSCAVDRIFASSPQDWMTDVELLLQSCGCQLEHLMEYVLMLPLSTTIFIACQYFLPNGRPEEETPAIKKALKKLERVVDETKDKEQADFMALYNARYEASKVNLQVKKANRVESKVNNLDGDNQKLKATIQHKDEEANVRDAARSKDIAELGETQKRIIEVMEANRNGFAELKDAMTALTDTSLSVHSFQSTRNIIALFPSLVKSLADAQSRVKMLEIHNTDLLRNVSALQETTLSPDEIRSVRALLARAPHLMDSVADAQPRIKILESDNEELLSRVSIADDIFVSFAKAFWMATFRDLPVNQSFMQAKQSIKVTANDLTVTDLPKLIPEFLSRLLAMVNRQTDTMDVVNTARKHDATANSALRAQVNTLSAQLATLQAQRQQHGNNAHTPPMTPPGQYYDGLRFNGCPSAYNNTYGYGNGNSLSFGSPQR